MTLLIFYPRGWSHAQRFAWFIYRFPEWMWNLRNCHFNRERGILQWVYWWPMETMETARELEHPKKGATV